MPMPEAVGQQLDARGSVVFEDRHQDRSLSYPERRAIREVRLRPASHEAARRLRAAEEDLGMARDALRTRREPSARRHRRGERAGDRGRHRRRRAGSPPVDGRRARVGRRARRDTRWRGQRLESLRLRRGLLFLGDARADGAGGVLRSAPGPARRPSAIDSARPPSGCSGSVDQRHAKRTGAVRLRNGQRAGRVARFWRRRPPESDPPRLRSREVGTSRSWGGDSSGRPIYSALSEVKRGGRRFHRWGRTTTSP